VIHRHTFSPGTISRHISGAENSIASFEPANTATESFSFRICYFRSAPIARNWPENHDFSEQSENHLPRDRPAFVPQFSERNSGSSFLSEVGSRVRRLACLAKCGCKPNARKWRRGSKSRSSGECSEQLCHRALSPLQLEPVSAAEQCYGWARSETILSLACWLQLPRVCWPRAGLIFLIQETR
jgi:hypothetical protein